MQPILKIWYDTLKDEGKMKGLKCKDCGAIEFPPVPVCNDCGKFDMEWAEISGECELLSFAFSTMGIAPYHQNPTLCGWVRLKEGMLFNSTVLDVEEDDQPALLERLKKGSIPARLEVHPLDDVISFPMIRLK